MKRKTRKEIDSKIRYVSVPQWKQIYTYHRTNKKSTQTDIDGKR